MAPPAPSSFPVPGGRDSGSSGGSSSGVGGGDSASSASASSSPPSAAGAPPPPPPSHPASTAASAATAAAPPAAIPLAPPPVLSVQQFPVLHYQSQIQQQQRLLSLHLSSASSPSPPHLLAPASSSPKPLLSLPSDPSPAPVPVPAPAPAPAPAPHSRDDCWSEGATLTLIQAWGDRYLELNRGNLKQKHWKDVADCVNRRANGSKTSKTDVQCKNRLDTLKKKYKLEKSKMVTGGGPSKWTFFERLDDLIGPNKKPKKPAPPQPAPAPPAAATGINCSSKQPAPLRPPSPNKRLLEEVEQKPASLFSPNPPPPAYTSAPTPAPHLHANPSPNPNPNPNPHHLSAGAAPVAADTISQSKDSPDTTASCPNGIPNSNGKGIKRKKSTDDDNPFKELAKAILKFGEVYERIETSKQQQLMDLEKQRMEFTKDLELQRLQLFMQTQVELAKLKHSSKHGNTEHYL